jgi:hypothetical protein
LVGLREGLLVDWMGYWMDALMDEWMDEWIDGTKN